MFHFPTQRIPHTTHSLSQQLHPTINFVPNMVNNDNNEDRMTSRRRITNNTTSSWSEEENDTPSTTAAAVVVSTTTTITTWKHVLFPFFFPDMEDATSTTWTSLAGGLLTIASIGMLLACLDNHHSFLSHWIGYIYVTCWSLSFYPQIITNYYYYYHHTTTCGVSLDFALLNVIGFGTYTIYNVYYYYYSDYEDTEHTTTHVQSNDVAFAIHALILSIITLVQTILLFQQQQPNNRLKLLPWTRYFLLTLFVWTLLSMLRVVIVHTQHTQHTHTPIPFLLWHTFCQSLSWKIKIAITVVKYIPQLYHNYQRQSCQGWSVWQILLDAGGGIFSFTQEYYYDNDMNNIPKLTLGIISLLFDTLFLLQHYVWLWKNPMDDDLNLNDDAYVRLPDEEEEESPSQNDSSSSSNVE